MKRTFAILFASTALAAGIGLPAWSAVQGALRVDQPRPAAFVGFPETGSMPVLVSDDDDGNRQHGRRLRHGGDDDDHDEGDGEDDDPHSGNAAGPAPAGSVAPPQNGLFGSGAAPKVQVN